MNGLKKAMYGNPIEELRRVIDLISKRVEIIEEKLKKNNKVYGDTPLLHIPNYMKTQQQELEELVTRLVEDKAISAKEAVFLLKLGIEQPTENATEVKWVPGNPYPITTYPNPDYPGIFPNQPYYTNPYYNDNTSGGYVKTTTTDVVNKKTQING